MENIPDNLFKDVPKNDRIIETFFKMASHLDKDKNIVVSISGGSDSDCILDLVVKNGLTDKVKFVFFDTGLEYDATKQHLKDLEARYGIYIYIYKAKKSIPYCTKQYGQPFLSKRISEMIYRLQSHGFNFVDEPFDELVKKYPNCKCALKWWCNQYEPKSMLNISNHRGLKEFMVLNPPTFKISPKCCDFAKKNVAHQFYKDHNTEITVVGVRKAEKGTRSMAYNTCFSDGKKGSPAQYRPLFWWSDADKALYCNFYGVEHSKCYTEYGLKRTGCCGCPYGQNLDEELKIIEKYEPKLYKVINTIFKDSYEYKKAYHQFRADMKSKRDDCKTLDQWV